TNPPDGYDVALCALRPAARGNQTRGGSQGQEMKLPLVDEAEVARAKIVLYLLDLNHRAGKRKARFFAVMAMSPNIGRNWPRRCVDTRAKMKSSKSKRRRWGCAW